MARAIDADVLIKDLTAMKKMYDAIELDGMIKALKEAPTINPVKHGKWEESDIPDSILSKCSICGFSCGAYTFNYCPDCGGRMDGDSK